MYRGENENNGVGQWSRVNSPVVVTTSEFEVVHDMHKNGSLFILCVMLDPHGDSKLLMQQCKESLLMTEECVLVMFWGFQDPVFTISTHSNSV